MGGRYFINTAQPLQVPRMGRMVYYVTKNRIIDELKKHFLSVGCPLEAPEKHSFGDIDVAVQAPIDALAHEQKKLYMLLLKILKPERLHTEGEGSQAPGDLMFHAAIEWPDDIPEEPFEGERPKDGKKLYIQLDIRVCKTAHTMRWNLFKHAHGDIWSMLGSTIRPYGLTVDEEAMYIRIPEIESADRKRSRITLTTQPDEILEFLGLGTTRYWERPFMTFDELFEYVARSPMFHVPPEASKLPVAPMKSDDRKRMDTRPMYRRWVEEFMPACARASRFTEPRTSKEDVKRQALERFHVSKDYDARLFAFQLEKQKEKIWLTMIKPRQAPTHFEENHVYRSCMRKALKKIILEGDDTYTGEKVDLTDKEGFFDEDAVARFIEDKGSEIAMCAYEKHQDAYHAKKKAGETEES